MNRLLSALSIFGIDLRKTGAAMRGLFPYYRDYKNFKSLSVSMPNFRFGAIKPCLADRYEKSGVATGHYFLQDLLVAQRIFLDNPGTHVDIGSRVDGFVAHVASFRRLTVLDIRPLKTIASNIDFVQANLMESPPRSLENTADSLSCLHALEHFGLGRYGDPIDPSGYKIGFSNILKIVKPGGIIYLSVPIGASRVEFNAHRVFGEIELIDLFDGVIVERFTYINDTNEVFDNVVMASSEGKSAFNCRYGCGIFQLRIPGATK